MCVEVNVLNKMGAKRGAWEVQWVKHVRLLYLWMAHVFFYLQRGVILSKDEVPGFGGVNDKIGISVSALFCFVFPRYLECQNPQTRRRVAKWDFTASCTLL